MRVRAGFEVGRGAAIGVNVHWLLWKRTPLEMHIAVEFVQEGAVTEGAERRAAFESFEVYDFFAWCVLHRTAIEEIRAKERAKDAVCNEVRGNLPGGQGGSGGVPVSKKG